MNSKNVKLAFKTVVHRSIGDVKVDTSTLKKKKENTVYIPSHPWVVNLHIAETLVLIQFSPSGLRPTTEFQIHCLISTSHDTVISHTGNIRLYITL